MLKRGLGGLVLVAAGGLASAQALVDLRTQSKGVDFQAAPYTKPVRTGVALPATCSPNEFFFLTTAAIGLNLYGCVSTNNWAVMGSSSLMGDLSGTGQAAVVQGLQNRPVSSSVPQTGQALVWTGNTWVPQTIPGVVGTIAVEDSGTAIGTRGVANFVPGLGIVDVITDSGTRVDIQQSVDTAVILTRASFQSGQALVCGSSGANASSYVCSMSPPLAGYQKGMVVEWQPDVNGSGGATTLNINSLGARALKLADGASDPQSGDLAAGQQYALWFDGTAFRFLSPVSGSTDAGATRPTCAVGLRGRIWERLGAAGVKDEVAVCGKDQLDSFAWRVLY